MSQISHITSYDNNFKFDEIGRKLSKRVENTVGKEEIARYEQFLLFHRVFKRLVSQGRQKVSMCGNGLKWNFVLQYFQYYLIILYQKIPTFNNPRKEAL